MKVIKRNGKEVEFDQNKIINAVSKSNNESVLKFNEKLTEKQIEVIAEAVYNSVKNSRHSIDIERIQDLVIENIMKQQAYKVAQLYTEFRFKKKLTRDYISSTYDSILSLVNGENETIKQENSNKNPVIESTQRDYIAGEVSKDITSRFLLPHEIEEAHKNAIIHFHDEDYFLQTIHNCCLVNLEDMLQNGTVISETKIYKPNSLRTACNIATQIVAQVASSQYGGQTISIAHLAPFVEVSRKKFRKKITAEYRECGETINKELIEKRTNMRLKDEITDSIQTITYQLITLMTTNGQTPFISINLDLGECKPGKEREDCALLIEEILKQRIKGLPDKNGNWLTPAFPKLLYVTRDFNVYEDSQYYYLTKLAAQCTNTRMVPDYISAKKMLELKGDVYPCMGCRSFLTPDRYSDKVGNISNALNFDKYERHYYGRFNQGVVTINLVDVACSSNKNEEKFWEIFEERLELCHRALRLRHERLLGTKSDVAPILWQYGALARLKPGETIDKLLYNGYSTLSLGYAGLYECVYYMKENSHTSDENGAKDFAKSVMQKMNDKCSEWKEQENIDYSLYGTPMESTTYKFAKALQNRFGIIPEVTDHNYVTNSYHINVREEIDAFSKLKFESEFQELSPGGAISYIETPNMSNNTKATLNVIKFMYDTIMYAEFNSKFDFCENCGYNGEILIKEDKHKKLYWQCPNCGCTDEDKMHIARRTCGYIGLQKWNQGRTQEIRDRVMHL